MFTIKACCWYVHPLFNNGIPADSLRAEALLKTHITRPYKRAYNGWQYIHGVGLQKYDWPRYHDKINHRESWNSGTSGQVCPIKVSISNTINLRSEGSAAWAPLVAVPAWKSFHCTAISVDSSENSSCSNASMTCCGWMVACLLVFACAETSCTNSACTHCHLEKMMAIPIGVNFADVFFTPG